MNIKTLVSYPKPADAPAGEVVKVKGISFYPKALSDLEALAELTEISNNSQLVRAAIAFARSRPDEFVAEIGVKMG